MGRIANEQADTMPYGINSSVRTLGSTAYLAAKAKGNNRMPSKRRMPRGAQGIAPQDPRSTVKAILLEPQSPGMELHILRLQRLSRSHPDTSSRMWATEPSIGWTVRKDLTQGDERGTYGTLLRPLERKCEIAYGARALWRRSLRSSPRAGKPPTWRREAGLSMSNPGGTRDA